MNKKVCHMTSVHRNDDTRILKKQCKSLVQAGYDVTLIAKGTGYVEDGVKVVGISDVSRNRLQRMLTFSNKIYKKALEIDAEIYQLHDPELLPYALKLKRKGKIVIFDSHEDYGEVFMEKSYIPKFLRGIIRCSYNRYLRYVAKRIDAVICCYHQTQEMLNNYNDNIPLIFNFPKLPDVISPLKYSSNNKICYAGELVPDFNHKAIVQAIKGCDIEYVLAGRPTEYIKSLLNEQTDYRGMVTFEEVQNIYAESSVGMCVLSYIRQCGITKGNLSNNKFFEYMYAGLPLVCTDFELWKEIVEEYECGICVKPYDIDNIKNAILEILENPERARQMGENGRRAVLERYNWKTEEAKLLKLYKKLLL